MDENRPTKCHQAIESANQKKVRVCIFFLGRLNSLFTAHLGLHGVYVIAMMGATPKALINWYQERNHDFRKGVEHYF